MPFTLRSLSQLLLWLATAVVSSSCKYECFGFPEVELSWVPYSSGDILRYTNGIDTIHLDVVQGFKTQPHYHRSSPVMDYECFYEAYYLTNNSNQGYYLKEMLSNEWRDGRMKVWLTDHDLFHFNLNERNQILDSVAVEFIPVLEIDGKNWEQVYKVVKSRPSRLGRIGWILKAKDSGVIRFYDELSQETWALVE